MNPHVSRKLRRAGWYLYPDGGYWKGRLWRIGRPTPDAYWRLYLWAGDDWTELSRHRTLLAAMAAADGEG